MCEPEPDEGSYSYKWEKGEDVQSMGEFLEFTLQKQVSFRKHPSSWIRSLVRKVGR